MNQQPELRFREKESPAVGRGFQLGETEECWREPSPSSTLNAHYGRCSLSLARRIMPGVHQRTQRR
jgi:hypothetical protein